MAGDGSPDNPIELPTVEVYGNHFPEVGFTGSGGGYNSPGGGAGGGWTGYGGVADAWNPSGGGGASYGFVVSGGATNHDPISGGGPTPGAVPGGYYQGYWAGVQAAMYAPPAPPSAPAPYPIPGYGEGEPFPIPRYEPPKPPAQATGGLRAALEAIGATIVSPAEAFAVAGSVPSTPQPYPIPGMHPDDTHPIPNYEPSPNNGWGQPTPDIQEASIGLGTRAYARDLNDVIPGTWITAENLYGEPTSVPVFPTHPVNPPEWNAPTELSGGLVYSGGAGMLTDQGAPNWFNSFVSPFADTWALRD